MVTDLIMTKLLCFWAGNRIVLGLKIFAKHFTSVKFLLMELLKQRIYGEKQHFLLSLKLLIL